MTSERIDILQDLIAAECRRRGIGWDSLAAMVGDSVPADAIRRFIGGNVSLNSAYVSRILVALGWDRWLPFKGVAGVIKPLEWDRRRGNWSMVSTQLGGIACHQPRFGSAWWNVDGRADGLQSAPSLAPNLTAAEQAAEAWYRSQVASMLEVRK